MLRRHTMTITTNGSAAGSAETPVMNGYLESIRYIKGNFADTVDFVATLNGASGRPVLTQANVTASAVISPREPVHAVADGAPISGGFTKIPLASDTLYIAVSNGGNGTTGTFEVTYDDGA